MFRQPHPGDLRHCLLTALLLAAAAASSPNGAYAQDADGDAPAATGDATLLDAAMRHRKGAQLDMQMFGGRLTGSSIGDAYLLGGRLQFWMLRILAIGATAGYGQLGDDHDFGEDRQTAIVPVLGHLELSNDAALRLGSTWLEVDLFARLGAGAWMLLDRWGPAGVVGGGIRMYFGLSWLALRIDVANHIHESRRPQGAQVDFDTLFSWGLVFFLPPDPSPRER